jgi:hypothetical protein
MAAKRIIFLDGFVALERSSGGNRASHQVLSISPLIKSSEIAEKNIFSTWKQTVKVLIFWRVEGKF